VTDTATSPVTCNVCGGAQFVRGPNDRLSSTGRLPRCAKCHSLERHRALQIVFSHIPLAMLKWRRAIQFAPDGSLKPDLFMTYESSTYGGDNSIDLQIIDRPDASYDYISLSQVLEFVPDDQRAFAELLRIGSEHLILNVTFSSNMEASSSSHYASPRPPFNRYHYYQRDFIDRFRIAQRGLSAFVAVTSDPVTETHELTHFFCRLPSDARTLMAALNSGNPGSAIALSGPPLG
jgi:hypothetical protein